MVILKGLFTHQFIPHYTNVEGNRKTQTISIISGCVKVFRGNRFGFFPSCINNFTILTIEDWARYTNLEFSINLEITGMQVYIITPKKGIKSCYCMISSDLFLISKQQL